MIADSCLRRLVWTDAEWTQDNISPIVMADPKAWRTTLAMLRPTRVGPAMGAGFGLVAAGVATRDELLLVLRGVSPPDVVTDIARLWPPEPS